jgi:RHS repeat-associated protein
MLRDFSRVQVAANSKRCANYFQPNEAWRQLLAIHGPAAQAWLSIGITLTQMKTFTSKLLWLLLLTAAFIAPTQAFQDPSLGRWLNRDPLGEPGFELARRGTPNVLGDGPNLYTFVHNSPQNKVDPDGRVVIAIPPIIIGGGIAISVADAFGLTVAACLVTPACRNALLDAISKAIDKCKPRGRSPEEEEKRKECVRRCHEEHEDAHELSFCIRRCNGGWNSPPDRPTPPGPIR